MIDRLTEEQRKTLILWGFFGVFLAILIIFLSKIDWKEKSDYSIDKEYHIVTDYSRYYTIMSIIDKFYTSINDKKYTSTMNMLDSNYVSKNKISVSNINQFFDYDIKVSFKGGLMCSKTFNKGLTSYYVVGDVIGQNVDKEFDKVYFEVILNENEMTFAISKIDESTYGGVCHA